MTVPPPEDNPTGNNAAVKTESTQEKKIDDLQKSLRDAEKWMIWLTGAMAFFSLCSVAVGLLQWSVLNGQLAQMKNTLIEMKTSGAAATNQTWQAIGNMNWLASEMMHANTQSKSTAESTELNSKRALDTSIEIARNDQRAWLGATDPIPQFVVGEKRVFVKDGETIAFSMPVKNFGKTLAMHYHSEGGYRILKSTEALTNPSSLTRVIPEGPNGDAGSDSVLQPGVILLDNIGANLGSAVATSDLIRSLSSGNDILYIFGRLDYSDIFGKRHFTTYCMFLSKDLAQFSDYRHFNTAN